MQTTNSVILGCQRTSKDYLFKLYSHHYLVTTLLRFCKLAMAMNLKALCWTILLLCTLHDGVDAQRRKHGMVSIIGQCKDSRKIDFKKEEK